MCYSGTSIIILLHNPNTHILNQHTSIIHIHRVRVRQHLRVLRSFTECTRHFCRLELHELWLSALAQKLLAVETVSTLVIRLLVYAVSLCVCSGQKKMIMEDLLTVSLYRNYIFMCMCVFEGSFTNHRLTKQKR